MQALDAIAHFDWAAFFKEKLEETHEGAPLAGLDLGGYRLVYRDAPSAFEQSSSTVFGQIDLTHSIGLTVSSDGELSDVLLEGPAFEGGLTVGGKIMAVNDREFDPEGLKRAIRDATAGAPIELLVQKGKHVRTRALSYTGGLRFPHLERIQETRARIDDILRPLGAGD